MDIEKKLRNIPSSPGVYLFKDAFGDVIYVGKASSLRERVRSHFQPSRPPSPKADVMASKVRDVEWRATVSEDEALLFEANLIKKHRPRYNVALRDDKTYPLIKITMAEDYPRVLVARGRKNDGALYFGPYTDAALLRRAVKHMRKIFPFRTCKLLPGKACVYRDLSLCPAPCEGGAPKQEYANNIKNIIFFIEGKKKKLIRDMSGRMKRLSQERRFEEAAGVRDQIEALGQVVLSSPARDEFTQLRGLRALLNLNKMPRRIEAFDISNIKGESACGSMVAFLDGKPYKKDYRMFKIRKVCGQDDYAMMREIVRRRYTGSLKDRLMMPDLIVIDGGKGHLSAAAEELKRFGLGSAAIIGLAKAFEHIYTLNRDEPIALAPSSKALHLIQRIRDESHRFAIRYHHILRRKALVGDGKVKRRQRRRSIRKLQCLRGERL